MASPPLLVSEVHNSVGTLVTNLQNTVDNFVAGKVKDKVSMWKTITSDDWILDSIQGIEIAFSEEPVGSSHRQITFSESEKELLSSELQNLQKKGVIKEVNHEPGEYLSTVFLRPKRDGTHRLILNLKFLNKSVDKIHFKMDSLKSAIALMNKDCYFASLDIRDAYYSVPVKDNYKKYFRFVFGENLLEYQGLPQGFRDAPRLFTKILKPVLATLHEEGHAIIIYFDDSLIQGDTFQLCYHSVERAATLLDSLGFTIHQEKSVFLPTQHIEYLGFVLNSKTMTVSLTDAKKIKIRDLCMETIQLKCITIQRLAEVIGNLVGALPAVQFGMIFIKRMEILKIRGLSTSSGNYDAMIELTAEVRYDLQWWIDNIMTCSSPVSYSKPQITVRSDASKTGWGGECDGLKTGGVWTGNESLLHINCLELKAALFSIQSFCADAFETHIKLFSDNTTTVACINRFGSTKELCNDVTRELWLWCIDRKILLTAAHLPGSENTEADEESRKDRREIEWKLNPEVFWVIQKRLGVADNVDLFASRVNFQLPCYVAWRPDPGAWKIDAFSLDWSEFSPFCFPPFSLVGRILQRLEFTGAECTLIVPLWTTQPWYSKLLNLLVDTPLILPQRRDLVFHPSTGDPHPLLKKTKFMACRLSGEPSKNQAFRQRQQTLLWHHGEQELPKRMKHTSKDGLFSVSKGVKIPFIQL